MLAILLSSFVFLWKLLNLSLSIVIQYRKGNFCVMSTAKFVRFHFNTFVQIKNSCIVFGVMLCMALVSPGVLSNPIPLEDIAGMPSVKWLQLSPNGRYISSWGRTDSSGKEGFSLNLLDLKTMKSENILVAPDGDYRPRWYQWANDNQILIAGIYPWYDSRKATTRTELEVLDIHRKKLRRVVTKQFLESLSVTYIPFRLDRVTDFLPDDDNHILMNVWNKTYKVALNKSKIKLFHKSSNGAIGSWETDRQNNVRIGYSFKGNLQTVYHRFPGEKKWEKLWEFDPLSADYIWPIGFDADPNILYVRALHEDREAIFKVNLSKTPLEKTLVHANENYDEDGRLYYSEKYQRVVGISTPHNNSYVFWDKEYDSLYQAINKGLPNTDNYLISMSKDERLYIVFSESDVDPGVYYLGDRDKKTLIPIAEHYPNLQPQMLQKTHSFVYKARDGLDIEAFVTFPKNHKKGNPVPTVVLPHDGPASRDYDDFDYWVQFFASRGYMVLRMNFRGSSGYGHSFMSAGFGAWGLEMQDDIEDGVRWAIEQGFAQEGKICIAGAGYGGYAALMGGVKSPDLYQCAISFGGVTDIPRLIQSYMRTGIYKIASKRLSSSKNKENRNRSPLNRVHNIDIPILLIHGKNDRNVEVSHGRRMHNALKKQKREVKYVELEDGSSYLHIRKNRIKAFSEMEAFLAEHLKE